MKQALVIAAVLILAGCTKAIVNVDPPAEALMEKPRALPALPRDADGRVLYEQYVNLRRSCGRAINQVEGLQDYVKTVRQ